MIAAATLCLAIVSNATAATTDAETVSQSARQIPLVWRTDVVVVGGSLGAVAAAVQAAKSGASVLLVAPRTYLGDDLCATLRLWLEEGERPNGDLTGRLFYHARTTTPLHVKRALEAALLVNRVDFLLGSYPTDVLRDEADQVAGIVIANRAGRQAIIAKVIIDATDNAVVARMAGAEIRSPEPGPRLCRRVVLGGKPGSRIKAVREIPAGVKVAKQELSYYVYEKRLDVGDGDFAQWAEAEQQMRDATYRDGQLRASERIQVVPTATIRGRSSAVFWPWFASAVMRYPQLAGVDRVYESNSGTETIMGYFRPAGVDRVYVIGGTADVPRTEFEKLLRPSVQERIGRRIGRDAAEKAADLAPPDKVRVSVSEATATRTGGDIRETLTGLRPTKTSEETITSAATAVPVLANVDVVVVGGGTSGACAAIAAGRRGAEVLVVEYQEGLGGVGTLGLIGRPYHGLNRGFTAEVPFPDSEHNTEHKMEWFRRRIREVGGEIWFGVVGCGAYVERDRVRGAVVVTPTGRGVVLARVVIDATGNADVAVAAGAASMYGGDSAGIALQGAGLLRRSLTDSYVNTDYLLVDESDMVDTWRAFVGMRLASEVDDYDVGPFVQTRERRRVVGDHVMSYLDQIAERTYPDSIVLSGSDYDSHGYPSEPYFALIPHTEKTLKANHPAPGGTCYTPYRCLLPRGVEGLLVTGLGISMLRDATAMVRMQKDMHNQGYAAGVAAAMAAEAGCTPRQIDTKRLQQHLVEMGNVPESVLTDVDSFPLPESQIRDAVGQFTNPAQSRDAQCKALAVILSHADAARPMLRAAYRTSADDARLAYAKVLGFLGEREAVPDLLDALAKVDDWDAKILQGAMAEYAHLPTPVDALILAAGYSGEPSALPAILTWLDRLDADVTLSHHRAVALALERLGDPAAAEPLARLLEKPGMSGHAMTGLEPLYDRDRDRRRRIGPLREIALARALYRCGDHQGLGERILTEYRRDIRGLFARHAQAVLDEGGDP
jgi:flavin-dependent dehydrogenase